MTPHPLSVSRFGAPARAPLPFRTTIRLAPKPTSWTRRSHWTQRAPARPLTPFNSLLFLGPSRKLRLSSTDSDELLATDRRRFWRSTTRTSGRDPTSLGSLSLFRIGSMGFFGSLLGSRPHGSLGGQGTGPPEASAHASNPESRSLGEPHPRRAPRRAR